MESMGERKTVRRSERLAKRNPEAYSRHTAPTGLSRCILRCRALKQQVGSDDAGHPISAKP